MQSCTPQRCRVFPCAARGLSRPLRVGHGRRAAGHCAGGYTRAEQGRPAVFAARVSASEVRHSSAPCHKHRARDSDRLCGRTSVRPHVHIVAFLRQSGVTAVPKTPRVHQRRSNVFRRNLEPPSAYQQSDGLWDTDPLRRSTQRLKRTRSSCGRARRKNGAQSAVLSFTLLSVRHGHTVQHLAFLSSAARFRAIFGSALQPHQAVSTKQVDSDVQAPFLRARSGVSRLLAVGKENAARRCAQALKDSMNLKP